MPRSQEGQEMTYRLGVDIALTGEDVSIVTIIRNGRFVENRELSSRGVLNLAKEVMSLYKSLHPATVIDVDTTSIGVAVFDILKDEGYPVSDTRADRDAMRREMRPK